MAVSSFSLQGTLLILSPSSATLKSKINFHLKTLNPQFYQVPVEITADLPVNHRHSLYSSGSVCFITPRILIVDLLTNKLPASIISGLIILNAHSVSETSTEAFIVRIFRSLNRSAFVRVFSDRPQAMVSGFAKAERTMKRIRFNYVEIPAIGVVHRRWHLWRRLYDLYLGNKQFAVVENPGLWNWTFTLKDIDGEVLAQVDRDWRGFGFEILTDAGQYVIRFGGSDPSSKIGLANAVRRVMYVYIVWKP
ncbi:DNA repair endonuclease UVH1-like [Lathyrus oleraceus]|uniref:DNA repair endonuclease UVH1-like n=1 Tax=Pisum sativum TaxID=3888 RepID=UPI0021D36861|nr:DNA repair endonuclease UVH1-like [Pisum sativum]